MEKLTIIGNVGSDAVIKTAKAGSEDFLKFSVACSQSYTNKDGEKIEKSTWYDCVYRRTQLAKYIKKGDQIHVEGIPSYSLYEGKDGKSSISLNLNVTDITLLNNKRE